MIPRLERKLSIDDLQIVFFPQNLYFLGFSINVCLSVIIVTNFSNAASNLTWFLFFVVNFYAFL